ncbi:MAG: sigma-70 family RNA polymerase sigma factor [Verrucomicrobiales bacterium]
MTPFTSDQLMSEADRLFAYALKRVGDRHRAEDLVQDVLVAAWEGRESFDGRSKLGTWLVGIMKFKILDHYRAKKRTPTDLASAPLDHEDWGDDPLDHLFDKQGAWKTDPNYGMKAVVETPANDAERGDIMQLIHRCMEGLPERLRLLFTMREIDQLAVPEAAAAAGVTPGSAAVLLTRARHQLRACLQRHQIDPP